VKKLILGLLFPVALVLILFCGGELFTGNCMYMTAGLLHKKVSIRKALLNLCLSYIFNFLGCGFGAYFFGYVTELFKDEPWLTGVRLITEHKLEYDFHVAFLRAIPANFFVCCAIFIAITSEDVLGKIMSCLLIVSIFAASGFEHCIANMYFIPQGLMYGADKTFGTFIYANLIPVTLGNMIGGCIFAIMLWYLYDFQEDLLHEIEVWRKKILKVSCFPNL